MTVGASIFLIAVGAILYFAVNATVQGVDIQTVGLILMVAGGIGLLIGLFMMANTRRGTTTVYRDGPPPPPR